MYASSPTETGYFTDINSIEIDSKQIEELISIAKSVRRCMDNIHNEGLGKEDWDEYKNFKNSAIKAGYRFGGTKA